MLLHHGGRAVHTLSLQSFQNGCGGTALLVGLCLFPLVRGGVAQVAENNSWYPWLAHLCSRADACHVWGVAMLAVESGQQGQTGSSDGCTARQAVMQLAAGAVCACQHVAPQRMLSGIKRCSRSHEVQQLASQGCRQRSQMQPPVWQTGRESPSCAMSCGKQ